MAHPVAEPWIDWSLVGRELRLSPRERAVVEGLWHGRKQAAIAAELGISIHTFASGGDTHWRRIKHKLGVTSPVEVVHRVYGVLMDEGRRKIRATEEFTTEFTEHAERKQTRFEPFHFLAQPGSKKQSRSFFRAFRVFRGEFNLFHRFRRNAKSDSYIFAKDANALLLMETARPKAGNGMELQDFAGFVVT